MGEDDAPGGSPVCLLPEVDPAYEGYLTDDELRQRLVALVARERAAMRLLRDLLASAAPPPTLRTLPAEFAAVEALLIGEITALGGAIETTVDARFAASADSPPSLVQLLEVAGELTRGFETVLPRIASNACHAALNRALGIHRDQVSRLTAT
jgi:hypothetical protein